MGGIKKMDVLHVWLTDIEAYIAGLTLSNNRKDYGVIENDYYFLFLAVIKELTYVFKLRSKYELSISEFTYIVDRVVENDFYPYYDEVRSDDELKDYITKDDFLTIILPAHLIEWFKGFLRANYSTNEKLFHKLKLNHITHKIQRWFSNLYPYKERRKDFKVKDNKSFSRTQSTMEDSILSTPRKTMIESFNPRVMRLHNSSFVEITDGDFSRRGTRVNKFNKAS